MPKRSATEIPADFDVVKAYFELKKLRADIEFIERSSRSAQGQAAAAIRDTPEDDDRIQQVLPS